MRSNSITNLFPCPACVRESLREGGREGAREREREREIIKPTAFTAVLYAVFVLQNFILGSLNE